MAYTYERVPVRRPAPQSTAGYRYERVPPKHSDPMAPLHAHVGRLQQAGHFVVPLADVHALGHGNPEVGERVLHEMFLMAAPRIIHADAVRQLGDGSLVKGKKVLQAFLDRAGTQPTQKAGGGPIVADDGKHLTLDDLPPEQQQLFAEGNEVLEPANGGTVEDAEDENRIWQPDGNFGRYAEDEDESADEDT